MVDTSAPVGSDDEGGTVKVTPRKEIRPNGTIKLKRPAPKHNKPGNWRDGSVVDGMSTPVIDGWEVVKLVERLTDTTHR